MLRCRADLDLDLGCSCNHRECPLCDRAVLCLEYKPPPNSKAFKITATSRAVKEKDLRVLQNFSYT